MKYDRLWRDPREVVPRKDIEWRAPDDRPKNMPGKRVLINITLLSLDYDRLASDIVG